MEPDRALTYDNGRKLEVNSQAPTDQAQKVMAQMGIHHPDQLPPQFRTKPRIVKKKVGEAKENPPPIRPSLTGNDGLAIFPTRRTTTSNKDLPPRVAHVSPSVATKRLAPRVLVNNATGGRTHDPALFNGYSGQPGAISSSSGSR
jgi:hypothetical protein